MDPRDRGLTRFHCTSSWIVFIAGASYVLIRECCKIDVAVCFLQPSFSTIGSHISYRSLIKYDSNTLPRYETEFYIPFLASG